MNNVSVFLSAEVFLYLLIFGYFIWDHLRRDKRWRLEDQQRQEERQTREREWKAEAEARERRLDEARNSWRIREDTSIPWRTYNLTTPETHPAEHQVAMLFLTDGRKIPGTYLGASFDWSRAGVPGQEQVLCWRPIRYVE